MSMLEKLLELDRKFKMDHNFLKRSEVCDEELIHLSSNFLNEYCQFHQLNADYVLSKYKDFLASYSLDLKEFKQSKKYPHELGISRPVSRIDYDLPLLLSVFVSKVRHQIMSDIKNSATQLSGTGAIIGVGPGLEIELMKGILPSKVMITAYDTDLSEFPKSKFKNFNFKEELFHAEEASLDFVYAIELLEHITHPYQLIQQVAKTLKTGGLFLFTTATDMPQFDHLYNFREDAEMEINLHLQSMTILEKKDHLHNYFGGPKTAKNTWYICKKLA